MATNELANPPAHPVDWRVIWYKTPEGSTVAPRADICVKAKTWFEARNLGRRALAGVAAEVEVAQIDSAA